MVINIILAILVLSIIIIIHEFGHFIVAKANGITVVEFSLGFGPKLIHFKKGETEYSLKLLPFGGACIMLGEDFLEADDDEQEDATEGNNTGKSGSELDNDFCNGGTAEDNGFGNASRYSSDNTSAGSYMSEKKKQEALEAGYDMSKSFANKSVWARIAVIAAGPIFNLHRTLLCLHRTFRPNFLRLQGTFRGYYLPCWLLPLQVFFRFRSSSNYRTWCRKRSLPFDIAVLCLARN